MYNYVPYRHADVPYLDCPLLDRRPISVFADPQSRPFSEYVPMEFEP